MSATNHTIKTFEAVPAAIAAAIARQFFLTSSNCRYRGIARQIVDGDEPLIAAAEGEKPLSIAVEELNQEKIRILAENEPDEEETEEFFEPGESVFDEEDGETADEEAEIAE